MSNARSINPVARYLKSNGSKTLRKSSTAVRRSSVGKRNGKNSKLPESNLRFAAQSLSLPRVIILVFALMVQLVILAQTTAIALIGNSHNVQTPNVPVAFLAWKRIAYAWTNRITLQFK